MKIGLVRHFRVDLKKRRWMTAKEYDEHVYNYDKAEVIPNEIVIDALWDKCYCSSLPRAITTAKTIYHGEVIPTDKLVEVPAAAFVKVNFRLPYNLWAILARFAWIREYASQPESRTKTLERVNEIVDTILKEGEKNILIVSHAGTMYEIQKILKRRGFRGRTFLRAQNGKLYTFER